MCLFPPVSIAAPWSQSSAEVFFKLVLHGGECRHIGLFILSVLSVAAVVQSKHLSLHARISFLLNWSSLQLQFNTKSPLRQSNFRLLFSGRISTEPLYVAEVNKNKTCDLQRITSNKQPISWSASFCLFTPNLC